MSQFEVNTTQGKGYVATNAASGFKTNGPLLLIPQADTVITRDLINDIGYTNTSDVLQYFGVSNFYQGESVAIRGVRTGNPFIDEMPDNVPYEDNVDIDSYEVIKGPAEVLYLNAALTGIVLKTTKKPLSTPQYDVGATVDNWGMVRGTVDATGPIGKLGPVAVGYRFVAAVQGGNTYFLNQRDDRLALHPTLQFVFNQTTVRIAFDFQKFEHLANGDALITPSGQLYTGAGRDESNQPPNNMEHQQRSGGRFELLQKLWPNWEMKLRASEWRFNRYGGIVFPSGGYNWATQTANFTARLNDQRLSFWTVVNDYQGNYHIWGPISNQSAFGWSWSDQTNFQEFQANPAFGTMQIPFANRNLINSIIVPQPQYGNYPLPAAVGPHVDTELTDIYYQDTLTVIPDHLTLVGGVTYSWLQTSTVANLNLLPWTATVVPAHQYLHRYGAVVNLTKDVVFYALDSTSFSPPSGLGANGQLLGNQQGSANEVGLKTALWDGKLSATVSYYKSSLTNVGVVGGTTSSGLSYYVPIGSTHQRGVDANIAYAVTPQWQVIASLFRGTDYDQNRNPVSTSYDNAWSVYTRFDFANAGPLHGWAVGGGATRIGSRWLSTAGISGIPLPASGVIKLQEGTMFDGFVSYRYGRHWLGKLSVENILGAVYPLGAQNVDAADPSPPRTLVLSLDYHF